MDVETESVSVEEYVDCLLRPESLQAPSDSCKVDELGMELPPWFDEDKFNRGRRFYWEHMFSLMNSMTVGAFQVFAVPSILRVMVATRRSSSEYTAYKRYLATYLHVFTWHEHELKPGTLSWKSLFTVRSRHLRAGLAAKLKGKGTVSQRDLALTQFSFFGQALLRPDMFGIVASRPDDWDSYLFMWRVFGYMLGIQDRYNVCRRDVGETREVCRILLARVYTPCLESVPEHFEHMTRVILNGLKPVNPLLGAESMLYLLKYMSNVPGYLYTESERMELQQRLRTHLKDKPEDTGVPSCELISTPGIEDVPPSARLLRLRDYDVFGAAPEYRRLTPLDRFKLTTLMLLLHLNTFSVIRVFLNWFFYFIMILMRYFPFMAFPKFGVRESFVNIFKDSPMDDTRPLPNSEYQKQRKITWYQDCLSMFW